MTVFFSGCPGVDLTVERVIRVNQNQLLWIQIRADDRPTANRVLDSVQAVRALSRRVRVSRAGCPTRPGR